MIAMEVLSRWFINLCSNIFLFAEDVTPYKANSCTVDCESYVLQMARLECPFLCCRTCWCHLHARE